MRKEDEKYGSYLINYELSLCLTMNERGIERHRESKSGMTWTEAKTSFSDTTKVTELTIDHVTETNLYSIR